MKIAVAVICIVIFITAETLASGYTTHPRTGRSDRTDRPVTRRTDRTNRPVTTRRSYLSWLKAKSKVNPARWLRPSSTQGVYERRTTQGVTHRDSTTRRWLHLERLNELRSQPSFSSSSNELGSQSSLSSSPQQHVSVPKVQNVENISPGPKAMAVKQHGLTQKYAVSSKPSIITSGHQAITSGNRVVTNERNMATAQSHETTHQHPKPSSTSRSVDLNITIFNRTADANSNELFEPTPALIVPSCSNCFYFQCDDGTIVPGLACNGIQDCTDGSDELGDKDLSCSDVKVQCFTNICVNLYTVTLIPQLCSPNFTKEYLTVTDSIPDSTSSAVYEISTEITDPSAQSCNNTSFFQCNDGSMVVGQACNGINDCFDGSDEFGGLECADVKVLCTQDTCVNQFMLTNFPQLCGPILTTKAYSCDDESMFLCDDKLNCVLASSKCDGVQDCIDGSDESFPHCQCQEFSCLNGNCVPNNATCNGMDDCGDRSDETCALDDLPRDCRGSFASGRFLCDDGTCIEKSKRCDGKSDCLDSSDELSSLCNQEIVTSYCGSGQYTCDNRVCIEKQYVCDGDDDCGDNSDEYFCSQYYLQSGDFPVYLIISVGVVGPLLLIFIVIVTVCYYKRSKAKSIIHRRPPSYEASIRNIRTEHGFGNPLHELKVPVAP